MLFIMLKIQEWRHKLEMNVSESPRSIYGPVRLLNLT